MRGNTLKLVFVASLLAASCGSTSDPDPNAAPSSGEAISFGEGAGDEAQPDEVASDDANSESSEGEPVEDEGAEAPAEEPAAQLPPGSVSMLGLLERVPLSAYDLALADGPRSIEISLTDYNAASAMAGLDRPAASDADASIDWLIDLTTAPDDGSGFAIYPATFPDVQSAQFPEEVTAEFGFSVFDVDQVVTLNAGTFFFAAVAGETVELAPDLADLGGGIVSAGEVDDFVSDFEAITAARRIGVPIRFASRDGLVGASPSTPAVTQWLSGGPSLRSVEEFAIAAEALDSVSSVSGYLAQAEFSGLEFRPNEAADIGFTGFAQPYNTIGIGTTLIDGRGASAVVYVFADESAAAAGLPLLDTLWRSAPVSADGLTVADFFDVRSVEQNGRAVLVVATTDELTSTLTAANFFFRQELVFVTN